MRPSEKKTTTESIELYKQSLEGNNYSVQSIKAYLGDLQQFIQWLQTRRVDWDIPHRIERIDIVKFINHLAEQKASAITRKRKLAAIRGFLKFCKDNQVFHVWRDKLSSITYSEELIFSMSASLQSTDRHHGIVGQEYCHFQRDS